MKMNYVILLNDTHENETIYIVGTGPSTRVFPFSFLEDKITIGLNYAWQLFEPTYSITIHPETIPFNRKKWKSTKWICKIKLDNKAWKIHKRQKNIQHFYNFNSNDHNVLNFSYIEKGCDKLYVGRGIQTGAVVLAAKMGAKNIILIGCDFCPLDQEHHGSDQHIRLTQYPLCDIYKEYYYYTVKVREEVKKIYDAEVLNLSPFIGSNYAEIDYQRLKQINNLPEQNEPRELYKIDQRKENIICDFL